MCEVNKQNADKSERNKALVACLAEKGGEDAAEELGSDLGFAVASEVVGPEFGVPLTIAYVGFRAGSVYKAYKSFKDAHDIVECIDKAYGN